MKCIVCCEDKAPEIHFAVPVICTECARRQLLHMADQIAPTKESAMDAPSDIDACESSTSLKRKKPA
ncbi:MAG TPA: hypothetical protein VID19_01515 [Candidatus Eremiobacteraceae bacterium]|jgi:hypothetical protein